MNFELSFYFLLIYLFDNYQKVFNLQRVYNLTHHGFYKRENIILNVKDKSTNGRNVTQIFIERNPWWLNLKKNQINDYQTATGVPTVKEIEIFTRKENRRGRSFLTQESSSSCKIIFSFFVLQLGFTFIVNQFQKIKF